MPAFKQLANFTENVQGENFNFLVARDEIGNLNLYLAGSKKKVASLRGQGAYLEQGKAALRDVISRHGEARCRSVFASAS